MTTPSVGSFSITGYFNPAAPPQLAGSISGMVYSLDVLTGWTQLGATPPTIPMGKAFNLSIGWLNQSAEPISGHIELTITKPDGSKVTLKDVVNQDNWADPGKGSWVQFEPITLDQAGTYNATINLSSISTILATFTVGVAVVPSPPFNMVITNVETMTDPIATAFWTAQITVQITNNTNAPITHVLRCGTCRPGQQNENDPSVYAQTLRYWDVIPLTTQLSITLGPGQSVTHLSPYFDPGTNYINQDLSYHSGVRIRYAWRILDELNNMSPSAYAGSYP